MPAPRPHSEHTFVTHDGVELFYRRWPAIASRRGCIAMFHRGHEHSGRMAHLPEELDLPEFDFFAWDARGHGRSPGPRGYAPSVGDCVRDVQCFVQHIRASFAVDEEDIAILAQSLAAVYVAAWAHDYAPKVRCLVLASPAFRVKLYVPLARPGLTLLQAIRGNFFIQSYVRATLLTRDPVRQASFNTDPLITRAISVNILLGLYNLAARIVADAQAIAVPTQLLMSGKDWVVHLGPQHTFFDRLGAAIKEKHVLADFYHDTFGEVDRRRATDLAREFILSRFAAPVSRPELRHADRSGPTSDEAAELARPLPALSARGMYWSCARMGVKLGGRLSEGLRLGHETGFNSGSTLDYVYRNRPEGAPFIGGIVDRHYLNAIGWRGIRQRKLHVEELLRLAADRLRAEGLPVRVLDIAAGHGRYVLDAFAGRLPPDAILLRDIDERNVRRGAALIQERDMASLARFETGDAFEPVPVVSPAAAWTLGVVSGLFELFSDNDHVSRSLACLAEAIAARGYLIYTCQIWHPQLEMIARTLTSHRGGAAWVMRRRTQEEMDQLVKLAGFEKIDQRIDEWGIFTVALARRPGACRT